MTFLDKVRRCNARDLSRYQPFLINGERFGYVAPARAAVLARFPQVFHVATQAVSFRNDLGTPEARTRALDRISSDLTATGLFLPRTGEAYAVKENWHDPAQLRIDRALVPGFGFRAYGVHVNGFVRKPSGLHIWIGTRALDRRVEPGKLDNMVAGGQPAQLSLMDNLIKECDEEASLPAAVAAAARPVSQISYSFDAPEGLKVDSLFCFDLELPEHVIPSNRDGEITSFGLHHIDEVLTWVGTTDRIKFNVNLVLLDFAIRHGVINPDRDKSYEKIVSGLHERP